MFLLHFSVVQSVILCAEQPRPPRPSPEAIKICHRSVPCPKFIFKQIDLGLAFFVYVPVLEVIIQAEGGEEILVYFKYLFMPFSDLMRN